MLKPISFFLIIYCIVIYFTFAEIFNLLEQMKYIFRFTTIVLLTFSTFSCKPLLNLYLGKPYASKEKSIKTFTKIHANTNDLYFYDSDLFKASLDSNKKIQDYTLLGTYIVNTKEEFLKTESETCSLGTLSAAQSLDDLELQQNSNFRKQLNMYLDARQRIQNFDGYTILVVYSQMYRRRGVRYAKKDAESYAKKHPKTQIIYLCVDIRKEKD